ncbi:hypothetical protein QP185_11645 [Sphingomonas aerolata]|uniref:hypothetical protein n=1 Tax=Sphingomonas aerolata TaxID=185951 RepID=UPI002FDF123C
MIRSDDASATSCSAAIPVATGNLAAARCCNKVATQEAASDAAWSTAASAFRKSAVTLSVA